MRRCRLLRNPRLVAAHESSAADQADHFAGGGCEAHGQVRDIVAGEDIENRRKVVGAANGGDVGSHDLRDDHHRHGVALKQRGMYGNVWVMK